MKMMVAQKRRKKRKKKNLKKRRKIEEDTMTMKMMINKVYHLNKWVYLHEMIEMNRQVLEMMVV